MNSLVRDVHKNCYCSFFERYHRNGAFPRLVKRSNSIGLIPRLGMFVNHVISDIYLGLGKGSASLSRINMFHAKITSNHTIYNVTLEDANTTTISWQVSPTYSIVNFGWVEHYCCSCRCSCGCRCRRCCLNYRISALVASSGACQTKIPPQQAGENFEVRVRPVSDEHKNQETRMHWSRCVGVLKKEGEITESGIQLIRYLGYGWNYHKEHPYEAFVT